MIAVTHADLRFGQAGPLGWSARRTGWRWRVRRPSGRRCCRAAAARSGRRRSSSSCAWLRLVDAARRRAARRTGPRGADQRGRTVCGTRARVASTGFERGPAGRDRLLRRAQPAVGRFRIELGRRLGARRRSGAVTGPARRRRSPVAARRRPLRRARGRPSASGSIRTPSTRRRDEGRLTLLGFVWPDQAERFAAHRRGDRPRPGGPGELRRSDDTAEDVGGGVCWRPGDGTATRSRDPAVDHVAVRPDRHALADHRGPSSPQRRGRPWTLRSHGSASSPTSGTGGVLRSGCAPGPGRATDWSRTSTTTGAGSRR